MSRRILVALATLLLSVSSAAFAQSLQSLVNQPPDGTLIGFLMTDGTVIFQGGGESDWWKLTPDKSGSYVKGTWKQLASLPSGYQPYAFASAVLADGRLLIEGGEYNFDQFAFTDLGAIYDPVKDTWTEVKPPKNWGFIGDSPSAVLPNGQYLLGRKFDKRMATLDPKTLQWTELNSTGKADWNAEEGWTLMPDGTILTVDVKHNPNSESFDSTTDKWSSLGNTPVNLQGPPEVGCIPYGKNKEYCPPGEIGPAILRPDGSVFATGALHQGAATGHTAVYKSGQWTAGPDFPNGDAAGDSYAALLPNGNVLVLGNFGVLYEFDGKKLNSGPSGYGNLLVLPTGEVIVGGSEVYTTKGTYKAAWAPTITQCPSSVTRGSTYKISGKQFNGLSQANAFGDEFETATNYPLVRITNNTTHHVIYAKTHDHSTMAVATGKATVFTNFDVPKGTETGPSTLEVVANGIPSKSVSITVQ